jgi:2-polyprenyl-3-methyl-5-hydroxy-6-metoxy-1,4-benzoquinol methylase
MSEAVQSPTPVGYDLARAEAFAERLVRTLNEAALCLMVSVGHRTGLFDVLGELPPSTSEEIARAAGLSERYVREWLGALVTARVVEHDPGTGRYVLPREHAAWLCRKAQADNFAVFAQYIPVLGSVESDIVECFRNGGGVAYERYARFHEVMAEDSGQSVLSSLFGHILPLVPGLVERLEGGLRVLDAGCGQGRALIRLAQRFPRSTFVGCDLSAEAIETARHGAESEGLTNVRFEVRDLRDFDRTAEPEAYDFVTTFDAVHDQPAPAALLRGIRRTLRHGGVYLMQDIHASSHLHENLEHPMGTLLYTVSCMHCMTVSLAQDGDGLGTMWGRQKAERMLREAGFSRIEVHRLAHDIQNDYWVIRP